MSSAALLRDFVTAFGALLDVSRDEDRILRDGAVLLRDLIRRDDWLPTAFATPDPQRYRQNLLHCDSQARFCIVSFVWGRDQVTPIHDHTVWGLVGVLRGAEWRERFRRTTEGRMARDGVREILNVGAVDVVSPKVGDVHRVGNAAGKETSVSVHVYGANIGAVHRSMFDDDGKVTPFISGYSNEFLPNIWDCSALPDERKR